MYMLYSFEDKLDHEVFFYLNLFSEKLFSNIIKLLKLSTVVEGNQKAPFSVATTLRCRGGHYSFPWIAPLYP